ncbi:PAS domain-containing sensor histidine kinase [Lichenihabitans psoromatis]|uniref:PAS domain-containing sensor histidine kinase n=1 Tax=Lichenihabitans psoromatis TaxID=2528642 RepID=UPI00103848FB|nr:PAS domain-containing sensor histidine kinase [Lichenihabitans psoromatis]
MTVLLSLLNHIDRLVHPDARASEVERVRHGSFIATRLGLFLAAIVMVPIGLASGHVPTLWDALVLAWLTLPLVAVGYVSRTGRLRQAEVACLITWAGFAVTACFAGGLSLYGAYALLLLIPLEATSGSDPRLVRFALIGTALVGLGLAIAARSGSVADLGADIPVTDAIIVGPALAYCIVLALVASSLQRLRDRLHGLGEQRYKVLSEAIGDLLLRYDRAGGVLMASCEAEQLFGIRPRDLLGRGFFERVHVADRPAFLKLFSDAGTFGGNVSARLRLRTSLVDGDAARRDTPVFAWIEVRARRSDTCEQAASPADPSIIAIVRDITAQVQHEQAIQQARAEAERANSWKDGFLANVSHELRTPLNAIIGFSEMLSSEALTPRDPRKQREYAGIITTSGHHLLSVVNSLLDISKIEAGRFDLEPEAFDVAELIRTCSDMIGLKAEQAGVSIAQDTSGFSGAIVADQRACRQIVINLLSNALKFTPRGGQVTITAKPQGTSVLIVVADTGIGIAARDLARLGNAFFQAKSGYDRPYEGTGLGLSVVRGLVGLHGGTIAVESALGEGTRVSVRLPLDCRIVGAGLGAATIETVPRYAKSPVSAVMIDLPKVQKIA